MDINELTIKQAREIAAMFPVVNCGGLNNAELATVDPGPWKVGAAYLIRTVTNYFTGKLVAVGDKELALIKAAWIADTGRFGDLLKTGVFSSQAEIEPYQEDQPVIIGRGAICDACEWRFDLPLVQK